MVWIDDTRHGFSLTIQFFLQRPTDANGLRNSLSRDSFKNRALASAEARRVFFAEDGLKLSNNYDRGEVKHGQLSPNSTERIYSAAKTTELAAQRTALANRPAPPGCSD